jgi:RimJ/RimL family protein N-acetyltransferase
MEDVPLKVRWINDPENNEFLHYDLPLREDATAEWFRKVSTLDNRLDMTILYDGIPVGIIGLLQIDRKNHCAELYITVGEKNCKGKGIAQEAIRELLRIAFTELELNRVYLTTEIGNLPAVRAYEKVGFTREGHLREVLRKPDGSYVDIYSYSILKKEFVERYGSSTLGNDSLS